MTEPIVVIPEPEFPAKLPLLAVRDVVFFPHSLLPLSVGRIRSIRALEAAIKDGKKLLAIVAQKDVRVEEPQLSEVYSTGVLAAIEQFLRMPDGTLKVFLRGIRRISVLSAQDLPEGYWQANLVYPEALLSITPNQETKALMRHLIDVFEEQSRISQRPVADILPVLKAIEDPSQLADTIAAYSLSKAAEREEILETVEIGKRLERLVELVRTDIEILGLERRIHSRVKTQIEKTQKEYYLNEQMKAIQKELKQKDDFAQEIEELKKKIAEAGMPKAAQEAATKELLRLEKMMSYSPESTVSRTYLDWMIHLPWSKRTREHLNIERAAQILDEDHYDLKKVKERILEHIAVCKLTKGLRGPILCFVGPPGVGKTSLGQSIARAMGRKFVRLSLGGVRDEAEIRGHRRTYIGSLPGRIIQSIRKAHSKNPLFLLDEIDKMGMDWRGDPAAALLEVLDPEQNSTFIDHYLDIEFDLSQVMFICTANTLEGIPASLQDRLEILRFTGYTHQEKILIAKNHLISKQLKEHGVKPELLSISDAAIERAILEYTREAGVRSLNREMASLSRKAAMALVKDGHTKIEITAENLPQYLGIPKFHREKNAQNSIGASTGLAWTEAGGVTMSIEVVSSPGKGELKLTGKLGTVMVESAQAGFSYLKSIAPELGISTEVFKDRDYHIHVPEGAIPKDGPSAGIAITLALLSLMTGRSVSPQLAMTGEITLRGRVLPIGGLKEKVLAAHREGIKTVLFPEQNKKDLEDIPAEILSDLNMIPVAHFKEVSDLGLLPVATTSALTPMPSPESWIKPASSQLPGAVA
jgi:ATP-dependent Lon protease